MTRSNAKALSQNGLTPITQIEFFKFFDSQCKPMENKEIPAGIGDSDCVVLDNPELQNWLVVSG